MDAQSCRHILLYTYIFPSSSTTLTPTPHNTCHSPLGPRTATASHLPDLDCFSRSQLICFVRSSFKACGAYPQHTKVQHKGETPYRQVTRSRWKVNV